MSAILCIAMTALSAAPAIGPLRVNPENPRYFTDGTRMPDGSLRAVYLTGSHHWNSLQDSAKLGKPLTEKFDYDGYLGRLARLNHNYIRMWSWEVGENDVYYEPAPWVRTGPGTAGDGKPKFDLRQFNPEYFARLRSRVVAQVRGADEPGHDDAAAEIGFHPILPGASRDGISDLSTERRRRFLRGVERRHVPL